MKSELFKVGKSDFVQGALTAVFASVVTVLYGLTSQAGFDVFSANWATIFNQVVNVSVATFMGFVFNSYIRDEDDNLLGWQK
jgi:hypothetical protein